MPIDDCPCFNLGLAHRKVARVFEDALTPLGLTSAQAHALTALFAQDGLLAKDLARELKIDAGSLTPLLDRLERQGLIRRCQHPSDRRATRLCLEDKAMALRPELEAALCQGASRLAERYSPEEFQTLMALLGRLFEPGPYTTSAPYNPAASSAGVDSGDQPVKLYDLASCPYCKMVRDRLAELNIPYEKVSVPANRPDRHEVYRVSGQWTVPVLVDGDTVLDDEEKILPYLDRKFGKTA